MDSMIKVFSIIRENGEERLTDEFRDFDDSDLLYFPPDEDENPDGVCGIPEGYYTNGAIVFLLRKHKDEPETIAYIADMME